MVIAVGILASFVFGLFPFKYKNLFPKKALVLSQTHSKDIRHFFIITAFYELTQIIINNSDILLVKHFFESYEAGLYASLALIGRIVYFIAWMFVMLLLPTVVELKKEGKKTAPILFKYVGYIAAISITIILVCLAFPETIITLLFGDSYIAMAPLLWKYAIATSMFAISNIFAYYPTCLIYSMRERQVLIDNFLATIKKDHSNTFYKTSGHFPITINKYYDLFSYNDTLEKSHNLSYEDQKKVFEYKWKK